MKMAPKKVLQKLRELDGEIQEIIAREYGYANKEQMWDEGLVGQVDLYRGIMGRIGYFKE